MEILIIWIALDGILTALVAQARGRSFGGWLVIGMITGIFGLLAVLVMENLKGKADAQALAARTRPRPGDRHDQDLSGSGER
jgi:hypothetical protein